MIHQKRDLETEIREAVKQRDWAKASEVQAKIDSLESGKSIDSKSTSKNKINSKVTVSYLYFRFKRSDPGHNKAIDLVSYDIHIFTGDFFIGIFFILKISMKFILTSSNYLVKSGKEVQLPQGIDCSLHFR